MKRMIRLGITAFVLVSPLFLAGCGDDDDPPQQQQNPPPTATPRLWVVPDQEPALAAGELTDFTEGELYYNAHTAANQAGEIRGQLDSGSTIRWASLDPEQEGGTFSTTAARGGGVLAVDETSRRVSGFVVTSGLVGANLAHVHRGERGVAGPPIVTLTGGPNLWVVPDGTTLPQADVTEFLAGNLYFNVHTPAFQSGEIRGQLDHTGVARLATLSAGQEPGGVTSSAYGSGVLVFDADPQPPSKGNVVGFVVTSGLTNPNIAHVHRAARAADGPPIVTMEGSGDVWVVPDGSSLPAGDVGAFAASELYYNVHTPAFATGEIRGQLDNTGDVRVTTLDPAQETAQITSTAFGAGILAADAGNVSGFLATSGLVSPTNAHVHQAARDVDGGVIVPLTP
jgi:hypothetical protein